MKNYEKALLYAYPALEEIIDAYDAIFLKHALNSFSSGRSAMEEAEALIGKIAEKDLYVFIKLRLDRVLESFSPFEKKHFSYKYFRDLPPSAFDGFDVASRSYFRRQQRLLQKFARVLNREGLTEAWFDDACMTTDLFPELLRRIAARERKEKGQS